MVLVDSHCHVDGPEFSEDLSEVLERCDKSGVRAVLCVGTGDVLKGEVDRAVRLAESHSNVYASVGVHPHDASTYNDAVEARLCHLVKSPKVIAWGEVGLDYHYDNSPREVQRDVFTRQLELAVERGLPVIIHTRDAEDDTVQILRSFANGSQLRGVMHCFGGSLEGARTYLDMGFYISFAGNVTFKKAGELRDVAKTVPLERILVETDCPFMSPEPVRGGRNEPANVVHTARLLSDLLSVDFGDFGDATTRNFERLFGVSIN